MAEKPKSHQRGRDAKTGEWIPVDEARRRKSTAVVENVKIGKRGKGK
jgi:hypothetical protein